MLSQNGMIALVLCLFSIVLAQGKQTTRGFKVFFPSKKNIGELLLLGKCSFSSYVTIKKEKKYCFSFILKRFSKLLCNLKRRQHNNVTNFLFLVNFEVLNTIVEHWRHQNFRLGLQNILWTKFLFGNVLLMWEWSFLVLQSYHKNVF